MAVMIVVTFGKGGDIVTREAGHMGDIRNAGNAVT